MYTAIWSTGQSQPHARPISSGPPAAADSALAAPLSAANAAARGSSPSQFLMPAAPLSLPISSAYAKAASLHSTSTTAAPTLNVGYPPAPLTQDPHSLATPAVGAAAGTAVLSSPSRSLVHDAHPGATSLTAAVSGLPGSHVLHAPTMNLLHKPAMHLMRACSNPDATSADGSEARQGARESPLRRASVSIVPRAVKESSGQGLSAPVSGSIVGTNDGAEGSQSAEQSAQSRGAYTDELSGVPPRSS